MAEALLIYTAFAVIGFTFLSGLAVGFWMGSRDRRSSTPVSEARRGRHARGGSDE